MTWIKTISAASATGRLAKIYQRIAGPGGQIDNILASHSLRPHTLEGHMGLYKAVLHHPRNANPKSLLETLGVITSHLNGCTYCVEHHFAGLKRLLDDDARADAIRAAIETDDFESALSGKELAAAIYARKLTRDPANMAKTDIVALRDAGFDDGDILEFNQVVAYFAYANRTVLGLGVNHANEPLGLSPNDSDDPENWSHG
ncbi:MAG: peroxidase-related enzyme [Rhizobiales bacterium]|nr:peroxidase-related enzyme [Hyphomicrobiales bacterium]